MGALEYIQFVFLGMSAKTKAPPVGKYPGWWILLVLLFAALLVNSQSVRVLSTKDGLPQSFISGLAQDSTGFIWIGTRNGLARYDGIQYRVFQHDPGDSATLASNTIAWINKDNHNHLLIEHESGEMDRFDPVSEKIIHIITEKYTRQSALEFVRRGWIADANGMIWGLMKKGGMSKFNPVDHTTREYAMFSGLPFNDLHGLMQSRSGRIWVLSQYGLSVLDTVTNKFANTEIAGQQFNTSLEFRDVADLHERNNGEIMWGDRRYLYFFNPLTSTIRKTVLPVYSMLGILWIRSGSDGQEYLETNGVVYRYSDELGLQPIGNAALKDPMDARSFLIDKSGMVWIGTNAAGIHQLDLQTPFFRSYPQTGYFPGGLLENELGLSLKELFDWRPGNESFLSSGYSFRWAYDRQNHLFISLKYSIYRYDFISKQIVKLPALKINGEVLQINALALRPNGEVISIGYDGGIYGLDSTQIGWKELIKPGAISSLIGRNPGILDLVADEAHAWITTEREGLLLVDLQSGQFTRIRDNESDKSLPTNQLLSIKQDRSDEDILWIGSYQGLIRLDKKTLSVRNFTVRDGLPDNTIYAIGQDNHRNLWLSTNKGLCRLNTETFAARNFNAAYGLPGDEFNRFHLLPLALPNLRLGFGGTEGWTIFDPMAIKDDDFNPPVAVTGIRINNVELPISGGNPILKLPLNTATKITLSYEDNSISLAFAGLQFNQPGDIVYRYRLEGYDDQWISAGHTPVAVYTKIPPGHYTLLLNASNTNGKWSNHIKKLDLVISPPWWRTWWSYSLYTIALASIVLLFINFRIRRGIVAREMLLKDIEARQLREMDEVKSRFFSNITHEFRTPLTLMMGPAEKLKTIQPGDPEHGKLVNTILRNGGQLIGLINQLLDLARLEARAFQPKMRQADLAVTVGAAVSSFENDAERKGITVTSTISLQDRLWNFAPEGLEQMINNLLFNAIKFTPAGGKIEVLLKQQHAGVMLTISDNGRGIPPSSMPHIFDRFYQAGNHESPGTGIGLAIVKELVEVQGGTIEVFSQTEPNLEGTTGTRFLILLPYQAVEGQEITHTNEETEETGKPFILVVEDNAEMASFIMDSLRDNFEVSHVTEGRSALDCCLEKMPDLVVSDVMMPGMDGFQFCRQLKTDIRISHIPVILLTAKTTQEQIMEGLRYGADDYLTKPFHLQELLLRINNLLSQQNRLREHLLQNSKEVKVTTPPPVVTDPFLERFYAFIEEHLDDPQFGVEQLCGLLGLSRTSLHRKLKTLLGMPAVELIRNYRLQRSLRFLQEGKSINDTAYLAGFSSAAYYIKCFKESNGLTPGEYIQQRTSAG